MISALLLPPNKSLIPLVYVNDVKTAVEFAKRWESAGNTHIEVLLRTPQALAATESIASKTSLVVAAGTITSPNILRDARDAGAHLGITPGIESEILTEAESLDFAIIPGVLTPSEIMTARSRGFSVLKLFPASRLGGTAYLKDLAAVFPEIEFIPSGGLTLENHQEYLELGNVRAVGGRWMMSSL